MDNDEASVLLLLCFVVVVLGFFFVAYVQSWVRACCPGHTPQLFGLYVQYSDGMMTGLY